MTLPMPRSAVVIGGGIVGLSIGLALQARALTVTVFDAPGQQASASVGNAGHIATEQHEPLASLATVRSLPRRLMSLGAVFRQGLLTDVLNPKVALFALALFPQFVTPAAGPVALQIMALATILNLVALVVNGSLILRTDPGRHCRQAMMPKAKWVKAR